MRKKELKKNPGIAARIAKYPLIVYLLSCVGAFAVLLGPSLGLAK